MQVLTKDITCTRALCDIPPLTVRKHKGKHSVYNLQKDK